jgi:hypothetical protein
VGLLDAGWTLPTTSAVTQARRRLGRNVFPEKNHVLQLHAIADGSIPVPTIAVVVCRDEFGQPKLQPIPGRLRAPDAMGRSEQARPGGAGFVATSEDPSEDRMRRDHKEGKGCPTRHKDQAGRVFASHLGNVVAARVCGMTHTT